jgi:succinate dehydrogenase / fumarate reductase iron-sulfur subunit
MQWNVTFHVFRYKQNGSQPHFDTFTMEVRPDEYVLDAVERIWAERDRSLVFRHACHHAACGACGLRVDGVEKLGCTTRIDEVTTDGGTITVEPLRNFAVVSDLLVDVTPFYANMEKAKFVPIRTAEPLVNLDTGGKANRSQPAVRYESCIECGICVSACPIPASDPEFIGPAALAAIGRMVMEPRNDTNVNELLAFADSEHGLWRCHMAFECLEACPAHVDPTFLIANLRQQVLGYRIKRLFGMG